MGANDTQHYATANEPVVFQADSDIVNDVYTSHQNYIIEHNKENKNNYCILYFSSNNIYFPNNKTAFTEQLISKNRFEWYNNRISDASKHIFIRDIKKQWYLTGINAHINSPEKLYHFLTDQTKGYKVITLGSSAGGFAAVVYGQLLNAERIYTFNGQFEVISLLNRSDENIDPIIFRNRDNKTLMPWYDTRAFIKNPSSIYYFHSKSSNWDIEQYEHIKSLNINTISFITSNHGIPFLKTNLPKLLNMPVQNLNSFIGKTVHPVIFSLKLVGIRKTLQGLGSIVKYIWNEIYIKTILKAKNLIAK